MKFWQALATAVMAASLTRVMLTYDGVIEFTAWLLLTMTLNGLAWYVCEREDRRSERRKEVQP